MINLFWYIENFPRNKHNLGDTINPWLISQLSGGEEVLDTRLSRAKPSGTSTYISAAGSIFSLLNEKAIVWGTGLSKPQRMTKLKPHKILAVRGPKTRQEVLKRGWECPEVYGDTVLLLPKVYNPKIEKQYDVGIIPHYSDYTSEWVQLKKKEGMFVIDITEEPLKVVDNILKCRRILSSSLHGLVVADAYGIPSTWIRLSDNIPGGHFKFHDYFDSVNRTKDPHYDGYDLRGKPHIHILRVLQDEPLPMDIDLEPLMNCCPFKIDIKH
jgi:pyruvyltransferase